MIRRRSSSLILFILSLSVLHCGAGSDKNFDGAVVLKTSAGESLKVDVEIVDTPELRSRGLMYRRKLPEGTGMLFLFPSESRNAFWMRNTLIPLDMIFAKDGKIVSLIQNAVPLDEKLLQPDHVYTTTLEVPGGYVSRHHVQVGDVFDWKRTID